MIVEIYENLGYADEKDCFHAVDNELAVVHACKHPCFINCKNTLDNKLFAIEDNNLYLNMIDPPLPMFSVGLFTAFIDFVDERINDMPVLVHCNKGLSRSPSLCLVYMAKRFGTLPDDSYESAKVEFEKEYKYRPGQGIQIWLSKNWNKF